MAEILNASKGGLTKTQIMYRVGLSFSQLVHYLSFLCELNLLEAIKVDKKTIYKTTRRGERFLQRFREIKQLLKHPA
jgi:predicted transcriptional regulator